MPVDVVIGSEITRSALKPVVVSVFAKLMCHPELPDGSAEVSVASRPSWLDSELVPERDEQLVVKVSPVV